MAFALPAALVFGQRLPHTNRTIPMLLMNKTPTYSCEAKVVGRNSQTDVSRLCFVPGQISNRWYFDRTA